MSPKEISRPPIPSRRRPTHHEQRKVLVDIPNIELVQQEQFVERSPPRMRQKTQANDEYIFASPPRDGFGVLRQGMLHLLTPNRIFKEEMAELKAETRELQVENKALREEMD